MVRSGLVMAWRLATSPTSTSPVLEKPTTDGVVRPPSAFGITTGSPASNTLTTELVVPRSIPTAFGICCPSNGLLLVDNYNKSECLFVNFSQHISNRYYGEPVGLPCKGARSRPPAPWPVLLECKEPVHGLGRRRSHRGRTGRSRSRRPAPGRRARARPADPAHL